MAKIEYKWREDAPQPKVEAQVFGDLVDDLAKNDPTGGVKAQTIVEVARKRNSPIHALFEWDNEVAGEAHRLAQARGYLGALQITRVHIKEGRAVSNRAFFSVRTTEQKRYVPRERILGDADLKRQVLQDACNDLQIYIRKFNLVVGLGTYIPRMEQVLSEMVDESNRITEEALREKPERTARSRRAMKAVNDNKQAVAGAG
jgi:hypothetical protein